VSRVVQANAAERQVAARPDLGKHALLRLLHPVDDLIARRAARKL
jgi:hypothetical protein